MKTIPALLLFVFICLIGSAQDDDCKVPDYDGIRKVMNDLNAEFYYPRLMERFRKSDTTLNLQEFRILYYGFLFTDTYSPYGESAYCDSLRSKFEKDTLTLHDYQTIIRYENAVLQDFPFNLRDLNVLAYSYLQIGDTISGQLANFKLDMIINTILSTGDGKSEKSGWHVISVGHEYDILGFLGFQFGGSQSLTKNGCDYLTVEKNKYDIGGFYFNVNQLMNKETEIFRKRGL